MEHERAYGFAPEPQHFVVRRPVEETLPAANPEEPKDLAAPSEPEETHHRRPSPELKAPEVGGPRRATAHHPSKNRHRRKCQICNHPDLEQIEEDFLQWRRPWAITNEYGVPEASLFRHAHAMDLFWLRRENLRLAIDRVIERGSIKENTGDTIIRAVRAQACLTDDNKWVEPAKRVIIVTETDQAPGQDAPRNITYNYNATVPIQLERGN